ncbi:AraC family transcriptional regulator [Bacillus sp. AFS031507]|uniref:helix-turn-helix domain-containing protein n=1 Tax=Bacillus sp. AFS031507 TaxID=2033496 RepID=UPI00211F04BE|nr:helix-turn-helix domain-containing protein [Bacillus sp. AFS031507]
MTGRTFIDVVNMYRIEEAEKLLLNTDMALTLIAEKIGCCNVNYFGKLFKKYRNKTLQSIYRWR